MGTRSLTIVYGMWNNEKVPLVNMYRQYDGYPSGHGLELAEFLDGHILVNGYSEESKKISNGMGCLAASLVAHFKKTTGGFYLEPVNARDMGQEYIYHVYVDMVVVESYGGNEEFSGSWEDFKLFCKCDDV